MVQIKTIDEAFDAIDASQSTAEKALAGSYKAKDWKKLADVARKEGVKGPHIEASALSQWTKNLSYYLNGHIDRATTLEGQAHALTVLSTKPATDPEYKKITDAIAKYKTKIERHEAEESPDPKNARKYRADLKLSNSELNDFLGAVGYYRAQKFIEAHPTPAANADIQNEMKARYEEILNVGKNARFIQGRIAQEMEKINVKAPKSKPGSGSGSSSPSGSGGMPPIGPMPGSGSGSGGSRGSPSGPGSSGGTAPGGGTIPGPGSAPRVIVPAGPANLVVCQNQYLGFGWKDQPGLSIWDGKFAPTNAVHERDVILAIRYRDSSSGTYKETNIVDIGDYKKAKDEAASSGTGSIESLIYDSANGDKNKYLDRTLGHSHWYSYDLKKGDPISGYMKLGYFGRIYRDDSVLK